MLEHLISLIEREIASVENGLVKGACPDYVSYREQVATLVAFRIAIDLAKKAFKEEDED